MSSVGFADLSTAPIYTIANSPLTANGTLDIALKTQTANYVFAGPTTGVAAQPTFRALVSADIPNNAASTTGTAAGLSVTLAATSGGTGQSVYAVGDLLYASSTTALSRLADVAVGSYLASGGVGTAPAWTSFPSIPVGANPSASVGLAAVNGSASTWMRSDGAPALSQAITPTWTGAHIFSASSGTAITVNGVANNNTATFQASTTSTESYGVEILAGTGNSGEFALFVKNAADNATYFIVKGDGTVAMPHYGTGAATFDASGNISSVSDERVKRDIARSRAG